MYQIVKSLVKVPSNATPKDVANICRFKARKSLYKFSFTVFTKSGL